MTLSLISGFFVGVFFTLLHAICLGLCIWSSSFLSLIPASGGSCDLCCVPNDQCIERHRLNPFTAKTLKRWRCRLCHLPPSTPPQLQHQRTTTTSLPTMRQPNIPPTIRGKHDPSTPAFSSTSTHQKVIQHTNSLNTHTPLPHTPSRNHKIRTGLEHPHTHRTPRVGARAADLPTSQHDSPTRTIRPLALRRGSPSRPPPSRPRYPVGALPTGDVIHLPVRLADASPGGRV